MVQRYGRGCIVFFVARILGRDVVIKFAGRAGLEQIDRFFDKYGKNAILICRLLPFISFDVVSYAAGLTSHRIYTSDRRYPKGTVPKLKLM